MTYIYKKTFSFYKIFNEYDDNIKPIYNFTKGKDLKSIINDFKAKFRKKNKYIKNIDIIKNSFKIELIDELQLFSKKHAIDHLQTI